MQEIKITIAPDGKELTGLYTDNLNWNAMGDVSIERATDVRYNNEHKMWMVHILDEGSRILDSGHRYRADAIGAETAYLNKRGKL